MDFSNLSDLLGAFFGDDLFGDRRGGPARGGDAAAAVELTLAEAAFGVTRERRRRHHRRLRPLPRQRRGAGHDARHLPHVRRQRPRAARLEHRVRPVRADLDLPRLPRPGRAHRLAVHRLPRPRPRRTTEPVEVQIPGGIMTGQRLRLAGRGHAGEAGAPRGDLYVSVTVAEDSRFQREGNDIVSVLDVPFTQAAMGTSVTVETLDGSHDLEVRPGTQPGEVLVLRGKGVPVLGGRGRGDHRVVVNVLRSAQALRRAALAARPVRGDGRRRHLRGRRRVLPPAADRVSVKRYRLRVPAAEAEPALARMLDLFPGRARGGARRRRRHPGGLRRAGAGRRASRPTTSSPAGRTAGATTTVRCTVGRVWIGPPWWPAAGKRGQSPGRWRAHRIVIDPGRAFGTGGHGSTRAALELLQRLEPQPALDLGCGSGVLSIAAAKLGFDVAGGASTSIRSRSALRPRTRPETASPSPWPRPTCWPTRCRRRRSGSRTSSSACCGGCSSGPTCRRVILASGLLDPETVAGGERVVVDGWAAELVRP